MADSTVTPETESFMPTGIPAESAAAPAPDSGVAKAKFAKALEEAKAGAQVLGKQAQDTAGVYRERITTRSDALMEDARVMGDQAREKATMLAHDGKAKVVEGLTGMSRLVNENVGTIDEKLGAKYGDYARSAARSMEEAAAKLDAKDIAELGEDAREAVRNSPALAIGIAATAGFLIARMFKGSKPDDND
ncbi:MAG: hypothetical protein V4579_08475 [Pseudomonadota bacterium]